MLTNKTSLSIYACKGKIATIWITFSIVILTTATIVTAFGAYSDIPLVVWEWLLPTITPTLSLITTSISLENDASIEKQKNTALNHVALYRTCLWLSVFYLIAIFSLLITQSFTEEFERSPREGFKISSIGLAFIQTLVIGVLTKFFVSTPNKNVR